MTKLAIATALAIAFACSIAHADTAQSYQINIAHTGSIAFKRGFAPPLKRRWVRNLGGSISYPVIANGIAYVTVGNDYGYGSQIYALNIKTGETVWQRLIDSIYRWSNAAYDNGQIFVVDFDGVVEALSAESGALNWWSYPHDGQNTFSSPPTATNGQLFVGGSGTGGTLYAMAESDGTPEWTQTVENGDNSAPTIGDGGVYVTYPGQYYKFDPATGALIWRYNGGIEGGGGRTSPYFGRQLYARDGLSNIILDADTGRATGTFSTTPIPAFFKNASGKSDMLELTNNQLYCVDVHSGNVIWSFVGDHKLSTAPIVINGIVVEGSGSGELYLLDGTTGSVLWSTNVGAPIPAPDEQNIFQQPLTGLGAGDNTLVVPAGSQISAYVPQRNRHR